MSRVVAPNSPVGAQTRGNSLSAVAAGATIPRVTGAVLSGKKRRQPLQSERQVSGRAPPQANPALLKPSGPGPLRSRRTWSRVGITSSEGGVLSRQLSLQRQILTYSSAVTEADSKPKVTVTRKKACPKNSKPKSPAAVVGWPLGRQKRKQARVSRPPPPNPQPLNWWSPTNLPPPHSKKSLISSINSPSNRVRSRPVDSSRPFPHFPQGQHTSRLSWRSSFSKWPNMAALPRRTVGSKAMRLVCWNMVGVRGKKLEYFLRQHGVDICLLSDSFLKPD